MSEPLHMIRLDLDPRRLFTLARDQGLPHRHEDLGFLVHAQLAALFGGDELHPFRVTDEKPRLSVLAYARRSADELRDHADRFADPVDHAACDWRGFAGKALPDEWPAGQRYGFEVRVCPVLRLAQDIETVDRAGRPQSFRKGSEVDVWVRGRWQSPPDERSREEVYAGWLGDRFGEAARLADCRMVGFRRSRLLRRGHGRPRKAVILERPDALLRGSFEIGDSATFHRLLARGVGRHCGFGFGMLLLRPGG